jgi:predicted dinucleotide-binding enzyme
MRPMTGRLSAVMRIAVIGTGNIGSTLGRRWQAAGHQVSFGSRTPGGAGPDGAELVEIGRAVASAEAVLLAVPAAAVGELVAAQAGALDGKVVIDATNDVRAATANARAAIVAAAPGAHYVRAFNTLGWENFAEPPADADLFFAADPEARESAETLIAAVGLRPQYVGAADAAATVDALLRLWFALVQQRGGNRKLAFRVVT